MPSDLDVYFFITHVAPENSLPFTAIQDYFKANFGWEWEQEDQQYFLSSNEPKSYQYTPYLRSKGFETHKICDILQITRQSVANATQRAKLAGTKEYINYYLANRRIRGQHQFKEYDSTSI